MIALIIFLTLSALAFCLAFVIQEVIYFMVGMVLAFITLLIMFYCVTKSRSPIIHFIFRIFFETIGWVVLVLGVVAILKMFAII